jgi:hypothetical protein
MCTLRPGPKFETCLYLCAALGLLALCPVRASDNSMAPTSKRESPSYQEVHTKLRSLCRDDAYLECARLTTATCEAAVSKAIDRSASIAADQLAEMPVAQRSNPDIVNATHLGATLGGMVGSAGGRSTVCLPKPDELMKKN